MQLTVKPVRDILPKHAIEGVLLLFIKLTEDLKGLLVKYTLLLLR